MIKYNDLSKPLKILVLVGWLYIGWRILGVIIYTIVILMDVFLP